MSKLPAQSGWLWLKQGFALFRKQPGILTMLLVANLLASLMLSVVPLVGPLLAAVLLPAFTMAVMMACHLLTQGTRVGPGVLLTGFRAPSFKALCKLGLVYLAILMVLSLLMSALIDPAFLKTVAGPFDPKAPPKIAGGDVMAMFFVFLLQGLALLALCFSAPLTYWQKMPLVKSVFYSVFAVLGAIRPFLIMLLSWFGIFMGTLMLVSLLSMGSVNLARMVMGWLVMIFVLVLQCAIYIAYRQIFGDPDAPAVSLDKAIEI